MVALATWEEGAVMRTTPRTCVWALVALVGLIPSAARATVVRENCCQIVAGGVTCFSGPDLIASVCDFGDFSRFVPGATCAPATGFCESRQDTVAARLIAPTRVFAGEQIEMAVAVRNLSMGRQVTVGDLAIHFTTPNKGPAIGPINIPVIPPRLLAAGEGASWSLGGVSLPPDLSVGVYAVLTEAFEPGGMTKLGGGIVELLISGIQGLLNDPPSDCVRALTNDPALPQDCTGQVDFTRVNVNVSGSNLYARLTFRDEELAQALTPGLKSFSWNFLFGGGLCQFGRFVNVGAVLNYEEETFGQPGSPIRGRWLGCQGGMLAPLATATAPGFTVTGVGRNMLEIATPLPSGVASPVGSNMGINTFALREGGEKAEDFAVIQVPFGTGY